MLVSAFSIVPYIGTEFVPELEEGTINLRVTLAPSSSLDTALSVAPILEDKLMAFPEVTYALSRIGRAEIGGDPEPVNNIEIYIGLKPVAEWTSASNRYELQNKMERSLEEFPGLLLNFSQPIATRVDELLSGVKAQLAIKSMINVINSDEDIVIKCLAVKALDSIINSSNIEVLEPLYKCLKSSDITLKSLSIRPLSKIGTIENFELIERYLDLKNGVLHRKIKVIHANNKESIVIIVIIAIVRVFIGFLIACAMFS